MALFHDTTSFVFGVVRDVRLGVKEAMHPMTTVRSHDRKTFLVCVLRYHIPDFTV